MADLDHWNLADAFTGRQAAALAVGLDPAPGDRFEPTAAYDAMRRAMNSAYRDAMASFEIDLMRRHGLGDPKHWAHPRMLVSQALRIAAGTALRYPGTEPAGTEHLADFEEAVFPRYELARWFAEVAHRFRPVYAFDLSPRFAALAVPESQPSEASAAGSPADTHTGALDEPGPTPLDTRTMASALDGIDRRNAEGWRRLLGDRPKWVQGATVTPGARGRESATWDPVKLALLLSETKRATQDRLSKMFRDRSELEQWRDAYRAALGAFSDYGL